MNYSEAGVDIDKGDLFIERIKPFIKNTYNEKVQAGIGGFAALYDQGDHYLATGTDGVGTKIKLAIDLGIHNTIGQDLVAMCVNDILCTGAEPLFFLDYMATSKLNLSTHKDVIEGIANACSDIGLPLIGGETAEMPGMYNGDDYDLAGFVVGKIKKDSLIDGSKVASGMHIVGIPSSGFHSNGYSLIRKLTKDLPIDLQKRLLTPTRIYQKEVQSLIKNIDIYGLAHITGGGLHNIARINNNFQYQVMNLPSITEEMDIICSKANTTKDELYKTFNMGVGMVAIVKSYEEAKKYVPDLFYMGEVKEGTGVFF